MEISSCLHSLYRKSARKVGCYGRVVLIIIFQLWQKIPSTSVIADLQEVAVSILPLRLAMQWDKSILQMLLRYGFLHHLSNRIHWSHFRRHRLQGIPQITVSFVIGQSKLIVDPRRESHMESAPSRRLAA